MSDTTNDIDALLAYLETVPRPDLRANLTALVAERNGLRAENEAQSYEGNSAAHWAASSKVYGNCISDCWKVLMLAGFPPNGNIDIVASLTALVAERDALKQENDALRSRCKASQDEVLDRVFEMDALKKRIAELESHPPADRDRELRERLVCAALTGLMAYSGQSSHRTFEAWADASVKQADATLAAMRKGEQP